jgi:hypothetical protein
LSKLGMTPFGLITLAGTPLALVPFGLMTA